MAFLFEALKKRKNCFWILFGISFGLAIGAKGTVFYWGPGLLFILVAWSMIHKTPLRQVVCGLSLAIVAIVILGSFSYLQNIIEYGNPFAPEKDFESAHSLLTSSRNYYAFLNGVSYFWQVFEPNSNPIFFRPLSNYIFNILEVFILSSNEHFSEFNYIFKLFSGILRSFGLNEDFASFGLWGLASACVGGLIAMLSLALRRGDLSWELTSAELTSAKWVASSFICATLFLVFFSYLQTWTAHRYRYFVLVCPLLAISSVYVFMIIKKQINVILIIFLAPFIYMAFYSGIFSKTHGFFAMIDPVSVPNYAVWGDIKSTLGKAIAAKGSDHLNIALLLPMNSWLAPYFRNEKNVHVTFLPIDSSVTKDSLLDNSFSYLVTDITHLEKNLGKFGPRKVLNSPSKNIFFIDASDAGGETSFFYSPTKGFFSDQWTGLESRYKIFNCASRKVQLTIRNPTVLEREIKIASSVTQGSYKVKAGEYASIVVDVSETDDIDLKISPAFMPSMFDAKSPDNRELGVRLVSILEAN